MKIIQNKLGYHLPIRTQKDFPIQGIEFIDITPVILEKEIYQDIMELFYQELADKKIDYIVAPEARGFLFGTSLATKLHTGCIPVRKKGKLPPTTVEIEFEYEKEYGKDKLCLPKLVNKSYQDLNFYIIDDIYATGNTVKAIKNAIETLGGNVLGTAVVMNITELNQEKDIYAVLEVEEE